MQRQDPPSLDKRMSGLNTKSVMKTRFWMWLGLFLLPTVIHAVEVVQFELVAIRRLTQPPLITQRIKLYSDIAEDTFRTLFRVASPQKLTLSFFTPLNGRDVRWEQKEKQIALRLRIPRGTTLVVAQFNGTSRRNLPLQLTVDLPIRLLDVFTDTTLALRGYRPMGEVVQDGDRYLHYRVPISRGQPLELRLGPPLPTRWILYGTAGLLLLIGSGIGFWLRRRHPSGEHTSEEEEEIPLPEEEEEEAVIEPAVVGPPEASSIPSPSTDAFAALGVFDQDQEAPAPTEPPPEEQLPDSTDSMEPPIPEELPPRATPQTIEASEEEESPSDTLEASLLGEEEEAPSFEDTLQEALRSEEPPGEEALLLPESSETSPRDALEDALIPEESTLPVVDPFQNLLDETPAPSTSSEPSPSEMEEPFASSDEEQEIPSEPEETSTEEAHPQPRSLTDSRSSERTPPPASPPISEEDMETSEGPDFPALPDLPEDLEPPEPQPQPPRRVPPSTGPHPEPTPPPPATPPGHPPAEHTPSPSTPKAPSAQPAPPPRPSQPPRSPEASRPPVTGGASTKPQEEPSSAPSEKEERAKPLLPELPELPDMPEEQEPFGGETEQKPAHKTEPDVSGESLTPPASTPSPKPAAPPSTSTPEIPPEKETHPTPPSGRSKTSPASRPLKATRPPSSPPAAPRTPPEPSPPPDRPSSASPVQPKPKTGKVEKPKKKEHPVPDDPEERIRQWLLKKKQQKKQKG